MRKIFALLLGLILAGCAMPPPPPPPGPVVAPGQVFPGDTLTVTWPNAQGWHFTQSNGNQWVFQKQGAQADETYIATISWLDLPAELTADDFAPFIKRGADTQNQQAYKTVSSTAQFSRARQYPCVHYHANAADAQPSTTQSARPAAPLAEMELLACKHPAIDREAFVAVFSHHGDKPDPRFETDAAAFFGGIQVPGH